MANIFAISNQKGGVGKTTTAVNLAASVSAAEFKVLLVDLDPQGNASSGLGVYPSDQTHSIYDVLVNEVAIADAISNTELPYLDLVYADQDLIGAEVELINAIGREHRLKEALAEIQHRYDYIFIDCPPALGLLTVNALAAADSVVIPLQCEYYAMEGMSQLLRTIQLIQKRINPELELEGIVLTMYDRRNNLSKDVELEIKKHFPDKVFETVIPRNVKLSEAPSYGKPILLYDVTCPGAKAYMLLANEVLTAYNKGNNLKKSSNITTDDISKG